MCLVQYKLALGDAELVVGNELSRLRTVYEQRAVDLFKPDRCMFTPIGACRNRIIVLRVIDGVVLAHMYLALVGLWLAGSAVVWHEMTALFLEHLRGNLPGRVVDKAVACSLQPGKAFLLKGRNVDEGAGL